MSTTPSERRASWQSTSARPVALLTVVLLCDTSASCASDDAGSGRDAQTSGNVLNAPLPPPPLLPPLPDLRGSRGGPHCTFDPDDPPERLSSTGCFVGSAPGPDLVAYTVRSPLWSDGSHRERYIALPTSGGPGSSPTPIETRVMVRAEDAWRFFTYRWEPPTDAARHDEAPRGRRPAA
jgi:hypothetical protein